MVERVIGGGRPSPARIPRSHSSSASPTPGASSAPREGDRLILKRSAARTAEDPTPIVPDGHLDYYRKRHLDFEARHPGAKPPTYYLGYGDVYVRRFTEVLSPELSKQGQEWMVQARKNLQVAIEDELARNPGIELDDEAFTAFAYDTHSKAYLDAGLTDLPLDDLIRVAVTPNLSDTLNAKGIKVIAETAERVARDKLAVAMDAPTELAAEILHTLKTSPDLLGDVVTLLDTAENARAVREGLLKLKAWPAEVVEGLWDLTTRQMQKALEALKKIQFRDLASA